MQREKGTFRVTDITSYSLKRNTDGTYSVSYTDNDICTILFSKAEVTFLASENSLIVYPAIIKVKGNDGKTVASVDTTIEKMRIYMGSDAPTMVKPVYDTEEPEEECNENSEDDEYTFGDLREYYEDCEDDVQ